MSDSYLRHLYHAPFNINSIPPKKFPLSKIPLTLKPPLLLSCVAQAECGTSLLRRRPLPSPNPYSSFFLE